MRWIAPTLLIGVFLRHDTSLWLPGLAPTEWFYALGGFWEVALCGIILCTLRPAPALLGAALWIGMLEGAQVGVCGVLMGHRRAPTGVNECDFLTGWPIGAYLVGLELVILLAAAGMKWHWGSRLWSS